MKAIIETIKGLVDWMSDKLKKDGVKRTVISVALVIMLFLALAGHENNIVRRFDQSMERERIEAVEDHQELYLASRDMYAQVKRVLRGERPVTGADYILLLEYHNGSENIATGYQFCKFDVTMEELSDTVPYIIIEDFKDENLYKYDILLSDRVTKAKMSSFSLQEIAGLDRNLMHNLNPNEHTQYVVFYNIIYKNMTAGTLMFLYKDDQIDYRAIANCGADVEKIMTDAMAKHEEAIKARREERNSGRRRR